MTPILTMAIVLALCVALFMGHFAEPIGRAFALLDFPDLDGGRKRHDRITPMVGGTAVVVATLAATALALTFDPTLGPTVAVHMRWFAAAVLTMYLIGLADDRFDLSAKLRLVLSAVALGLVVMQAPDFSLPFLRFADQSNLLLLGSFGSVVFVLLCLVGLMNAVNMADGKDGVVLGMALIWTGVLWARMPAPFVPILAAMGASVLVMFIYNLRKHLFLGDSGSYAISVMYGMLAIYAYNHSFAAMRAEDVAVLFAVPVFDTIRLMVARRLNGQPMMSPDRNHLHHHLHRSFGTWWVGLVVYLAMVAIPNLGVLWLPGTGLFWLAVEAVLYALVMWRTRFELPTMAE